MKNLFKINKTKVIVALLAITLVSGGMFAFSGTVSANSAWAYVLEFFGKANVNGNIAQSVILDGGVQGLSGDDSRITSSSVDLIFGGETTATSHVLENRSSVDQDVELVVTDSTGIDEAITTTFLEEVDYIYSKTWSKNGDVLVTVEDTNDGFLQWTYVATTTPTSGTLKMTVEIDNPTGFGITTFDDGSHDGWYYYDASGITRLGDYSGYSDSNYETSLVTDGLRVRINKDVLPNEFKWQGFANFHLASNWIEIDQTSSPWVPTGEATILKDLTSPLTLDANETINFKMLNKSVGGLVCNDCTVTLTVNPK